jgi:hypothetical protein
LLGDHVYIRRLMLLIGYLMFQILVRGFRGFVAAVAGNWPDSGESTSGSGWHELKLLSRQHSTTSTCRTWFGLPAREYRCREDNFTAPFKNFTGRNTFTGSDWRRFLDENYKLPVILQFWHVYGIC